MHTTITLLSAFSILGSTFATSPQAQCQETTKLTAADGQLQDRFGNDVAITTTFAVAAEKLDTQAGANAGAVYVFGATGAQEAKLVPAGLEAEDLFGFSIDADGIRVAVGATGDDDAGDGAGAAYVFRRDPGGWVQEAKLTPGVSNPLSFGWSIALSGDTLAVGSPSSESVLVYRRAGTTWSLEATIPAVVPFEDFSDAIDLQGNALLVGARAADQTGLNTGAGYLFERAGTIWSLTQQFQPSGLGNFDQFGSSVAISGRLFLFGAPFHQSSGAVFAYVRTATGFNQEAVLIASDAASLDLFGTDIAAIGSTLVVGALGSDAAGVGSGAAYQFDRDALGWSETAKFVAGDGASGDAFGTSVAVSRFAIIGAEFDSNQNGGLAGSAYIWALCQ